MGVWCKGEIGDHAELSARRRRAQERMLKNREEWERIMALQNELRVLGVLAVGVVIVWIGSLWGCGKKEASQGTRSLLERVEHSVKRGEGVVQGEVVALRETSAEAGAPSAGGGEKSEQASAEEPSAEFLPPGFSSWKEFDETYAKFRAERVAAQESLPVNEDGSRVWLGQIVFADEGLDKQIKTFGMAKALVKGSPECVFMKMDGRRVKFAEPGLGEAIGKIAAKKYVKVFGWLDEKAGTIKARYIDVAGDKYVWKDGALVRE